MPDLPDDYPFFPGSPRYPMVDNGELAARLGSPIKHDRRGEVIWYSDVRSGLAPFSYSFSGTGGAVFISADYAFHGPYSILLRAGSTLNHQAQINWYASPPYLDKWGLEVAADILEGAETLTIGTIFSDGNDTYQASVRITVATSLLEILTTGNAWQSVGTIQKAQAGPGGFHVIKLVYDFSTRMYVRLIFGMETFDLSAIPVYSLADPGEYDFVHNVTLVGVIGSTADTAIGHVVVTANEP